MSKTQFTYVETKRTKGIVDEIVKLAELEERSLNHYVGQILSKFVEDKKEIK